MITDVDRIHSTVQNPYDVDPKLRSPEIDNVSANRMLEISVANASGTTCLATCRQVDERREEGSQITISLLERPRSSV